MKAKEYVEWLHKKEGEVDEKQAFGALVFRFMEEVAAIAKMRHATSNSSLLAILREQNQKWNAMIKFDKRIARDGFEYFVDVKMPFIRDAIENEKLRRRNI